MCECSVCRQVPGLKNTIEGFEGKLEYLRTALEADPDNPKLLEERSQIAQNYLSARKELRRFTKDHFHTLSEHGTRVPDTSFPGDSCLPH